MATPNPDPNSYEAQFKGDGIIRHVRDSYTMNGAKLDEIGEYGTDDYYYQTTIVFQAPMPPPMVDMAPPPGIMKIIAGPGMLIWRKQIDFKVKAANPVEAFQKFKEFAKAEYDAFGKLVGERKLVIPSGPFMPGTGELPPGFPGIPQLPPPGNHKKRRH